MSARTVEEISQEYSRLCAKAGHCQYQIETLKKDLEMINQTLRDLNLEAAKAKEAAEKAKETSNV
jgi:septation ring formation regulator EzrA